LPRDFEQRVISTQVGRFDGVRTQCGGDLDELSGARGPSRGRHEGPVGESCTHSRPDAREAMPIGPLEPGGEASCSFELVGSVASAERLPELRPWWAELGDELVDDLPKRLGLARQRQEKMAVVDAAAAEGDTRVADNFIAEGEAHRVGAGA
jgi:hypothetical protein